jgi:hypothetical protein
VRRLRCAIDRLAERYRGADLARIEDLAARAPKHSPQAWLLRALVISGLVAAAMVGAASGSLAIFSDGTPNGDNAFGVGKIALTASRTDTLTLYGGLVPGSPRTTGVDVTNTGSGQMRYAVTTAATNPDGKNLAGSVQLEVRTVGTSCDAFDGTVLYSGALVGGYVGDPATGQQAGDRTLAAGIAERLCIRFSLATGAPAAIQGASTVITFSFAAEQTYVNP